MRNPVYAKIISENVLRLHREYPGLPIGEHIAHALDGSDIYNISDKDLAENLSSYLIELEMNDVYQSDDSPDEQYNE